MEVLADESWSFDVARDDATQGGENKLPSGKDVARGQGSDRTGYNFGWL
jgi:hypothetical protein